MSSQLFLTEVLPPSSDLEGCAAQPKILLPTTSNSNFVPVDAAEPLSSPHLGVAECVVVYAIPREPLLCLLLLKWLCDLCRRNPLGSTVRASELPTPLFGGRRGDATLAHHCCACTFNERSEDKSRKYRLGPAKTCNENRAPFRSMKPFWLHSFLLWF